MMYKIENDLAPTHMKEMFVKTSDLHTYSTRSATSGGFHPPHRKLNIGKASFSYRGAHVWNQLPVEIRGAQSLENFQNSLKTSFKKDFRCSKYFFSTFFFPFCGVCGLSRQSLEMLYKILSSTF